MSDSELLSACKQNCGNRKRHRVDDINVSEIS